MAPTHVSQTPARRSRVAVAATLAALAFFSATGPAAAHHDHVAAAPAAAATTPSDEHHAAAPAPTSHAGHAAATTAKKLAPAASMWQISSPSNPRVAKGPRGPLWRQYTPVRAGFSPMGGTLAARYVSRQLEAARETADARGSKSALTTAQATKKLTKKCQRLVKITKSKDVARLRKADRKARTKCLEQRRKIIADSKKKPDAQAPTPASPTPSTPAPANPTPAGPTPAPNPPAAPNPAPTTPTSPTSPATPGECTTPGSGTVVVTAVDEGQRYDVNMCGIKAGTKVPFKLVYNDESGEPHDLTISSAFTPGTDKPSGTIGGSTGKTITSGSAEFTADLTPGTWYLICSYPGHGSMRVEFKVFA